MGFCSSTTDAAASVVVSGAAEPAIAAYTCGNHQSPQRQGHIMGKKLTERQKSRVWERMRNRNFQASQRLEGFMVPLVTLTPEQAEQGIGVLKTRRGRDE